MSLLGTAIHGAEAVLETSAYLDREVVAKRRAPKSYRHAALDGRLRDGRTRDEGNLLLAARLAGVPVPVIYDIDRAGATLLMEAVPGRPMRDVLPDDPDKVAAARLTQVGVLVARLHAAGITHGDLTTSNLLVPDEEDPASVILIDFGLGQATQEDEPCAVDLHLIEEALQATEARAVPLFEAFLDGYRTHAKRADAVLRRLEAVRERGRYRGAS